MRNYKAMGDVKLRGCYVDLQNQPPEDHATIVALAEARGIASKVAHGVPAMPHIVVEELPGWTLFDSTVFKPMLAFDAGRPVVVPIGEEWRMEPKYDGIRFIVHKTEKGVVRCYGGRNSADHTGNAPLVERELESLPNDTIVDGELVTAGGRSGDTMSHLASRSGALEFVVFDVMRIAGNDVRSKEFADRRRFLVQMEQSELLGGEHVKLTPQWPASQELFEQMAAAGWEGMVAKKTSGLYRSGKRSRDLLKLKNDGTAEAIVTGFQMGKGQSNKHRVGAIEFKMLASGRKSSCGYDCDLPEVEPLIGKVIEIAHQGIFEKTGSPRFPRFVRMRPDRDPVAS